jgi:thiosulfate dehydrogenase [quinone] large subunit
MGTKSRSLAYALFRISLGVHLSGRGLIRIHNGVEAFAQTTAEHLAKSHFHTTLLLTIGVTANQQWDIVGQQLLYSLVFFLLLFLIEHNSLALDSYLSRSNCVPN